MASDDADRSTQILATNATLLILTNMAVILRLTARKISNVKSWLDDWAIVSALTAFMGSCACSLVLYKDGLRRHVSTVAFSPFIFIKATWVFEFLYQATVCLYKLSLVLIYYRIFALKSFKKVLHLMATLIGAYFIWSIFQTLFQCSPISAIWRIRIDPHPGDRCIPPRAHLLSLAIPNVILDWALLFLPVPIIWSLKMSIVHKLEVSIVVAVGASVCIFSIIRAIEVISVSQTDVTWNYTTLNIWSLLEMSIGIICPCLVTLRPILSFIFGQSYHKLSNQKSAKTSNTNFTDMTDNVASGPFHRMKQSSDDDEARLAYHNIIAPDSNGQDHDIPLTGIRVIKDINVESREAGL